MFQHYREQGVREIVVNAHARYREDPILNRLDTIAADYDAKVTTLSIGPWTEGLNPLLYKTARHGRPRAWYVIADQDELQVYPALVDVLSFCDRHGYEFIEGALLDRVSRDGVLKAVQPHEPIWEQFPIGAMVSGPILGAVINKIVAAKEHVRIGRGQHHAYTGLRCPISEFYIPVHHFKWIHGLLDRLDTRVKEYQALRETLWVESQRFISYYKQHGCIALNDPRLLAAECAPDYPHWGIIRRWRIAASFFHGYPLSSYQVAETSWPSPSGESSSISL
jgi:hypothetical protein